MIRQSNILNIVARFSDHASKLGVSAQDLYTALLADAEDQPPNWNLQGRQADVWKEKGTFILSLLSLLSC
jgi:hypothetical protein